MNKSLIIFTNPNVNRQNQKAKQTKSKAATAIIAQVVAKRKNQKR